MVNCGVLARPNGFLKIIELGLAVTCIALLRHYNLHFGGEMGLLVMSQSWMDRRLVGYTTIGGMILVTLPLLIAHIAESMSSVLEVLYCLIGAVMFCTSGGLVIEYYQEEIEGIKEGEASAGLGLGSLCIIAAIVYLIDLVFALRNARK